MLLNWSCHFPTTSGQDSRCGGKDVWRFLNGCLEVASKSRFSRFNILKKYCHLQFPCSVCRFGKGGIMFKISWCIYVFYFFAPWLPSKMHTVPRPRLCRQQISEPLRRPPGRKGAAFFAPKFAGLRVDLRFHLLKSMRVLGSGSFEGNLSLFETYVSFSPEKLRNWRFGLSLSARNGNI